MLAAAHINSGSVFCSSEAIFESLPRDLLVDQLLEALLVILRDFYNLHFNQNDIGPLTSGQSQNPKSDDASKERNISVAIKLTFSLLSRQSK